MGKEDIIKILERSDVPLSSKELSLISGSNYQSVSRMCRDLWNQGEIEKIEERIRIEKSNSFHKINMFFISK